MPLLQNAQKHQRELKSVGERAIENGKRHGVPAYYMDPAFGDGIIRELPDGTRQKVRLVGRHDIVLETLSPAS